MVMKNKKIINKPRKIALFALIGLALSLLILGGLGSGKLQYGFAHLRCGGAPIDASRFMASYSYYLPTDSLYRPGIFSEYFCTEAEAQKNGFRRSPLSSTPQKQTIDSQAQREEEERFNPEKVNYTLYVPAEAYTYGKIRINTMSNGDPHSFYYVKEDGYNVGQVRQGAIPSEYQLCRIEKYTCSSIGKDKRGSEVMKQMSGRKNDIVSYTTNIGNTFVNLTGVNEELTEADIINIFNSLKEYEDVQ